MRMLIVLISLGILVGCGSVSNPEDAIHNLSVRPGFTEVQVDSIAQTLSYFPDGTQFSIALVQDSITHFYGAIRTNDTLKTTNNRDNVFEIGSLSKVFTSTLLTDLVVEGLVDLDQPIQDFLDLPLNDSLTITFRQLANHTSGLPRIPSGFIWESIWHMNNPYKDYDEEKLQEYLVNDIELVGEQGKTFQYSNIGAGLLGYVLTKVTGESYEEMIQQRIFKPLNMRSSTTLRSAAANRLVRGLNKQGNPTSNWDLGALPGAGAILSTAEDLAKFAQTNFDRNSETFSLQHKKTYSNDNNRNMALGWFMVSHDSSGDWLWHNGGTGGYRSSMVLDVSHKNGAIVLSNISAGHAHAGKIDDLSYFLLGGLITKKNIELIKLK